MFILFYQNKGETYGLLDEKICSIGRKSDGIYLEDTTVSRKHVTIVAKRKTVYITHLGSNVTYVNNVALNKNAEFKLDIGSKIVIGQDHVFILQEQDFIVSPTCLNPEDKTKFTDLMNKLGLEVKSAWTPKVTHVVISTFVLTKKTLCALIKKQSIVFVDYFASILKKIAQNLPLPSVSQFQPNVFQDTMARDIEIDYNLDRSKLFHNKVFIFPNNLQMEKVITFVTLAGGEAVSMEQREISKSDLQSMQKEYLIVINEDYSDNINPTFDKLIKYYTSLNRNTIPAQEIALAILAGQSEMYCNSRNNKLKKVMTLSAPLSAGFVLVDSTQTQRPEYRSDSESSCSISLKVGESENINAIPVSGVALGIKRTDRAITPDERNTASDCSSIISLQPENGTSVIVETKKPEPQKVVPRNKLTLKRKPAENASNTQKKLKMLSDKQNVTILNTVPIEIDDDEESNDASSAGSKKRFAQDSIDLTNKKLKSDAEIDDTTKAIKNMLDACKIVENKGPQQKMKFTMKKAPAKKVALQSTTSMFEETFNRSTAEFTHSRSRMQFTSSIKRATVKILSCLDDRTVDIIREESCPNLVFHGVNTIVSATITEQCIKRPTFRKQKVFLCSQDLNVTGVARTFRV